MRVLGLYVGEDDMHSTPIKLTASEAELRQLALAAGELHRKTMDDVLAVYQRCGRDLAAVMRHYLSLLRERHLIAAAEEETLVKATEVGNGSADRSHLAREIEKLCGRL